MSSPHLLSVMAALLRGTLSCGDPSVGSPPLGSAPLGWRRMTLLLWSGGCASQATSRPSATTSARCPVRFSALPHPAVFPPHPNVLSSRSELGLRCFVSLAVLRSSSSHPAP